MPRALAILTLAAVLIASACAATTALPQAISRAMLQQRTAIAGGSEALATGTQVEPCAMGNPSCTAGANQWADGTRCCPTGSMLSLNFQQSNLDATMGSKCIVDGFYPLKKCTKNFKPQPKPSGSAAPAPKVNNAPKSHTAEAAKLGVAGTRDSPILVDGPVPWCAKADRACGADRKDSERCCPIGSRIANKLNKSTKKWEESCQHVSDKVSLRKCKKRSPVGSAATGKAATTSSAIVRATASAPSRGKYAACKIGVNDATCAGGDRANGFCCPRGIQLKSRFIASERQGWCAKNPRCSTDGFPACKVRVNDKTCFTTPGGNFGNDFCCPEGNRLKTQASGGFCEFDPQCAVDGFRACRVGVDDQTCAGGESSNGFCCPKGIALKTQGKPGTIELEMEGFCQTNPRCAESCPGDYSEPMLEIQANSVKYITSPPCGDGARVTMTRLNLAAADGKQQFDVSTSTSEKYSAIARTCFAATSTVSHFTSLKPVTIGVRCKDNATCSIKFGVTFQCLRAGKPVAPLAASYLEVHQQGAMEGKPKAKAAGSEYNLCQLGDAACNEDESIESFFTSYVPGSGTIEVAVKGCCASGDSVNTINDRTVCSGKGKCKGADVTAILQAQLAKIKAENKATAEAAAASRRKKAAAAAAATALQPLPTLTPGTAATATATSSKPALKAEVATAAPIVSRSFPIAASRNGSAPSASALTRVQVAIVLIVATALALFI